MNGFRDQHGETPGLAALDRFASRAATALQQDERVRALWLTGSLVAGTADAQSDVDLRAAVRDAGSTFITNALSAITLDYTRFDLVVQSAADTQPRALEAVRLLFDKDGVAERVELTMPAQHDPLAALGYVVEEFIRLLGMLPIVVERDDVPIGMEGQMGCYSLLLMENGIDWFISAVLY